MLALVIDHAATVDTVALDGKCPWVKARAPTFRHGAHHVAMTVDQHCRQRGILDARADQHRTVDGIGIVEHLGGKTQLRDHRPADVTAIAFQLRLAQWRMAFGGNGHECAQTLDEAAVVEGCSGTRDRTLSRCRHRHTS